MSLACCRSFKRENWEDERHSAATPSFFISQCISAFFSFKIFEINKLWHKNDEYEKCMLLTLRCFGIVFIVVSLCLSIEMITYVQSRN